MRIVNITELKARLSAHLRMVRNGEEVLVCDRNRPVARIVPIYPEDYSEQDWKLIIRGVMTPPLRRREADEPWPKPAGNVPDEVMEQIWREERDGREDALLSGLPKRMHSTKRRSSGPD